MVWYSRANISAGHADDDLMSIFIHLCYIRAITGGSVGGGRLRGARPVGWLAILTRCPAWLAM